MGKTLAILFVGILSIALTGVVQGNPSFATNAGNSCKGCHSNILTGKMQVSDTGILTDLGTELNGKVRGPLQTFQVIPGNVVTLSVDVLNGNDKFAVQLKRLEKGGQANDQANFLVWSEANGPTNVWNRQEVSNPPYFTNDRGNKGLPGSWTPATYTFDLFVDASTPADFYDLEFAVAGKASGMEEWYQDAHFYVEVLGQPTPPNLAVVRGGAMYDKWWVVAGIDKPTTDNPLWASRPDITRNHRSGADTWRCKECHGWDYKGVNGAYAGGSHRTGIAGILGTTKTAQELFDVIKTDHAYGTVGLNDEGVWDLVEFVTEGLVDVNELMDANGVFIGDAAHGQSLFETGMGANIGCAVCHGRDGLAPPPGAPIDYDAFVGMLSNENPSEFQHKVQFGHPGTAMPSSFAGSGTIPNLADLGAYAQTLADVAPIVPVARGGAMYDKWWAVTGAAKPATDNPLWTSRPDTTSNTRSGADTWRCKECHGWDYRGVDGAYADGSHRTGIAGIFGTTKTAQAVFDLLKTDHAYGTVGLSDDDIWDLVEFVLDGLIDTGSIIDADGAFTGNTDIGQTLYNSGIGVNIGCAACHGPTGLTPPPGHPEFDAYVGMLSNENPWEFQHKVQSGHPGTTMPGSFAGGGTTLDVANLGTYAQTLPQEPAPEQITFNPDTPPSILSQGKVTFEGICGMCHGLPTAADMKAFPTDAALVASAIGMAEDYSGLSEADTEEVARYLLALRHDVVVALLDLNSPQTYAMFVGLLGIGMCIPARRRRYGRSPQHQRAKDV